MYLCTYHDRSIGSIDQTKSNSWSRCLNCFVGLVGNGRGGLSSMGGSLQEIGNSKTTTSMVTNDPILSSDSEKKSSNTVS